MSPLSLLLMPFRTSPISRLRDKSSLSIDDDIYQYYSNFPPIYALELRKEREEPEHEFVILKMDDMITYYCIERRPSKGTNIKSKLRGCRAEDTITPLNDEDYKRVCRLTDSKITQFFWDEPEPDLYTVLAFCNAIRKDPDSEKFTLAQFNCFFFARTLTLLIARHFLLRQYCRIHKSPRNDVSSLLGPEIDAIVDEAMNSTFSWDSLISISIVFDSDVRDNTYKDLRQYILEMNKRHCKRVTQFGGKGHVVYDALDKKKDEIWRRMHSDPTPSERRVDLDLALDSHAMALPDEGVKELLFARAARSNDITLSRLVQAL